MTDERDDESTIIIDFKSLNESSLKKKKAELSENAQFEELEFNIPDDEKDEVIALTQSNILDDINCPLYYLEYKTEFFQKIEFAKNFKTATSISNIQDLNTAMVQKEPSILLIYYNASPKLSNQITLQVKNKFPDTKTVIIAKNLSDEKSKLHAKSKYSANEYISYPFQTEELELKLKALKKSMIPG